MQPPTEPTLRSHIDTKKKTHDQSLIYTGHDWRQKWRNRVQDDAEKASVDSFAYAHYLSLLRDSTEEATRAIDCWKWATSSSLVVATFSALHIQKLKKQAPKASVRRDPLREPLKQKRLPRNSAQNFLAPNQMKACAHRMGQEKSGTNHFAK